MHPNINVTIANITLFFMSNISSVLELVFRHIRIHIQIVHHRVVSGFVNR
jgi:hypothetical protein